ncbi:DinB family protein [Flavobacterium franklandianum]|uniref:DinB family protein n=1 Tax=Flavobacterium franklandianum TaxID=2594430 RepID=A0A553CTQ3_9FLAO|nr:DinB family protein [Flavobacterium franklandianum]TRX23887.1 DinB family protein [Flavobacterium franklandianum]TRX27971.1 DinB family protein [Flavobacterium franklandianum]
MNQTFEITRTSRKIVSQFLDYYSLEQLNKIPEGYKNNLIWNIAHIVVTQQLLVYKFSGLPMMVSDELVQKYMKGTKPELDATQADVDEIKYLLLGTVDKTEIDFNNDVFKNYQEYPTSTGFVLNSVEDAMVFNNFHEGLHIGIMMGLRKFV